MNADGNCLFRSLSDQLYHDNGAKHDIIRHDVCNHLSKNKEEFQHFLLMGDDDEDVIDIDEYISKMREVRKNETKFLSSRSRLFTFLRFMTNFYICRMESGAGT